VPCQDEAGRLWDVLWMLRLAIGRSAGGCVLAFALHVRNDNRERTPPLMRLKTVAGLDDNGEPSITVMVPEEFCPKRGTPRRAALPAFLFSPIGEPQ
jgi:hypothetical protein